MCRVPMYCVGLPEDGKTFRLSAVRSPTGGPDMTIPGPIPGFWSKDEEADQDQEGNKHLRGNGWTRSSAIGEDRTQNRSSLWHTCLYLEGRQSRRRETINPAFLTFTLFTAL